MEQLLAKYRDEVRRSGFSPEIPDSDPTVREIQEAREEIYFRMFLYKLIREHDGDVEDYSNWLTKDIYEYLMRQLPPSAFIRSEEDFPA